MSKPALLYKSPWLRRDSISNFTDWRYTICNDVAYYFELPPLHEVDAVQFCIYDGYRKGALHLLHDEPDLYKLRMLDSQSGPTWHSILFKGVYLLPEVRFMLSNVLRVRDHPYYVECWYKLCE